MQNFTEVRCLALDFKDQNYGCEIEMTGLTREQAARAVAALFGTSARRTRESVTYDPWEVLDNDGKKWRFVYDGSISAVKRCGRERLSTTDTLYKVELNSPVLQYSEMEKLQQVIRTLRHAGAIVNTSCGMHVHVDAAHHTPQSLKNALSIMYSKEDILFAALEVNESRVERWCKKVEADKLVKIRKLPSWAGMNRMADLWYPFITEELLELSPKDYRQFCSALGQRYAFETDIPKEGYDTANGAFHCSLVTTVSEKEAILLTRVAGQMFGAYLPDKALLNLADVPKKQVTLEPCMCSAGKNEQVLSVR